MDEQPTVPTIQESTIGQGNGAEKTNTRTIVIAAIFAVIILGLLIAGVIFLLSTDLDTTSRIRDIFIIFMALEFLLVGVALIVLMVQLATLINLLQNEVKPILLSTQETVSTLRGTVTFLGDHLAEPVIKMNTYLAGLKKLLDLVNIGKR